METDARFEIDYWQAVPLEETASTMKRSLANARETGTSSPPRSISGSRWVVTAGIKPVDLYVYLKARFGEPNGLTMLFKNPNDSDNLIHWHHTLRCPSGLIEILCFRFRIEFFQPFSDDVAVLTSFLTAIKLILHVMDSKWVRSERAWKSGNSSSIPTCA